VNRTAWQPKALKARKGTSRATLCRINRDITSKDLAKGVFQLFPYRHLSKLAKESEGEPNADYGSNQQTLRMYHYTGTGVLQIGLMYTSDQKVQTMGKGVRIRCQKSEKNIKFLKAAQQSVSYAYPGTIIGDCLKTMRATCIVGARTGCHTDTFGGPTPNRYLPHGDNCDLLVFKDIDFRCSLVRYKGHNFIPLSYDTSSGLQLVGVHPEKPSSCRLFEIVGIGEDLKELTTVGMLDFIVLGVKEGKLQCCPFPEPGAPIEGNIPSPTVLGLHPFTRALEASLRHPKVNCGRSVRIGREAHKWSSFEGWRHRHKFVGKAPMCPRTHIFFRTLRQQCTSDNFRRVGWRNFVSFNLGDDPYPSKGSVNV
jgi:hypothetical protein